MSKAFPLGATDPYSIVVTTNGVAGSVMTSNYFTIENALVHELLDTQQPKFIDTRSITALSYFEGNDVTLATSTAYFNTLSPLYNTPIAVSYRALVGNARNTEKSASIVKIETTADPNADLIIPFILNVRDILDSYASPSSPYYNPSLPVNMYLFGGFTAQYDIQIAIYKLVPLMIGITVLIVLVITF